VLNQLAKFLHEKEMLPAITFIFSRKLVESCAHDITVPLLEFDSKVPYTIKNECDQIIRKLPNYKEYLELPEYNNLVKLLEKGIGIHHSGMIPILREIVELMISKKYIKLLFATESFAIGLDCPIKTAVFSNLTKFDGTHERYLMAHEYTQMAGRAGRRGIDTIGNVVHCNNLFNLPTHFEYKSLLNGKPQQLVSKYHISFDLIFNLLKNGQTKDFHLFSDKSMVKNELIKEENYNINILNETNEKLKELQNNITVFNTPRDILEKYENLKEKELSARNNQRRKIQNEINTIEKQNINIKKDIINQNLLTTYKKEICSIENTIDNIQNYFKNTTTSMCEMLINSEFIQQDNENNEYSLTERGVIASNIAEVNSLILTDIFKELNYFNEFEPAQIVGILSCFVDVKVPDNERISIGNITDYMLHNSISKIHEIYNNYQKLEYNYNVNSGYDYDNMKYDLIECSMKWCNCSNEIECKEIIQEIPISIGEFNKALLKIVNIVRECINVFEILNKVDILHKFKQIEPMILKYVTTNQSLYV
tara:strand:- start:50 stop:1660 length:1611 start_codon:yes stop_codon:yes gene_type:complete